MTCHGSSIVGHVEDWTDPLNARRFKGKEAELDELQY